MGDQKCFYSPSLLTRLTSGSIAENTFSLLCASATSRGLPSKVTRNIASLQRRHNYWTNDKYNRPSQAWNPSLPLAEYREPKKPPRKRAGESDKLDEQAWNALGEVVRMAEGRDGLTLGRVKDKQRSRLR